MFTVSLTVCEVQDWGQWSRIQKMWILSQVQNYQMKKMDFHLESHKTWQAGQRDYKKSKADGQDWRGRRSISHLSYHRTCGEMENALFPSIPSAGRKEGLQGSCAWTSKQPTFRERLPWARCSAECFGCAISFNPQTQLIRVVLWGTPCFRWGHRGPAVEQCACVYTASTCGPRIQVQAVPPPIPCSCCLCREEHACVGQSWIVQDPRGQRCQLLFLSILLSSFLLSHRKQLRASPLDKRLTSVYSRNIVLEMCHAASFHLTLESLRSGPLVSLEGREVSFMKVIL